MKNNKHTLLLRIGAFVLLLLMLISLIVPALVKASSPPLLSSQTPSSSQPESGSSESPQSTPSEPEPDPFIPPFEIEATAAVLMNLESGQFVYEKNADDVLVPASLVKMMTAILVMEKVQDLNAETVTAETWVFNQLHGKNASNADIRNGETLTVSELMYALMLPSANEAALMLANYVSGGYMVNFLYMMNARAQSLGCTNTNFADPNGLSEDSYTTARDMAIITRAFVSNPQLVQFASTSVYEMPQHEKHNSAYNIFTTNRLLVGTSPYAKAYPRVATAMVAGKTGSLGQWQNFASMAQSGGESFVCVVLNSPNSADTVAPTLELENPRYYPAIIESALLYNWVFTALSVRPALDTTQPVAQVPVRYSTQRSSVLLLPATDLRTMLPTGLNDNAIEKLIQIPDFVPAPVKEGDVLGSITLTVNGRVIGTSNLLASQDISRNDTLYAFRKVQLFIQSTYLKVLIVVVLIFGGAYAALVAYAHKRRAALKTAPQQSVSSQPPQRKPPAKTVSSSSTSKKSPHRTSSQKGTSSTHPPSTVHRKKRPPPKG